MSGVFDPGLQPERTELAWRRTALALAVGSLVAMRLLPLALGSPWWILGGVAGLAASLVLWIGARRRYRATTLRLRTHGDRTPLPGAAILLALAVVVSLAGVAGLAVALNAVAARG